MDRTRDIAWKLAVGGVAAVGLGVAILVGLAATEVAADPSLSLVDGYWAGRLPWTAVGVDLVVFGSTVAIVGGVVAAWLGARWIVRASVIATMLVAAFWWATALMPLPGGAPCTECAPRTADPIVYAYSLPEAAVVLLIVPAIVVTLVAILIRPRTVAPDRIGEPGSD